MAPVDALINSLSKMNRIRANGSIKVVGDPCAYDLPKESAVADGDDDDDDDGDYDCAPAA